MPKHSSAFSVDRPEESPGFLLWQTTVLWQRRIKKALDAYHISHAQFVILAITLWFESKHQTVSQSLLISQSKLDKMTVSQALKKLVANGYIQRSEHKEDTRVKMVCLTQKGKKLSSQLVPLVEAVDADFFKVTKNSQKMLISLLNDLVSKTLEN